VYKSTLFCGPAAERAFLGKGRCAKTGLVTQHSQDVPTLRRIPSSSVDEFSCQRRITRDILQSVGQMIRAAIISSGGDMIDTSHLPYMIYMIGNSSEGVP
jgi:hypothetical protein